MFKVDNITPVGAQVLLRRLPVPQTTTSGLHLPEAQVTKNMRCEVLKVGSGEWVNGRHYESGLKPGDIVITRQWEGHHFDSTTKELLLIDHNLIEAKVVDVPWPAPRTKATAGGAINGNQNLS